MHLIHVDVAMNWSRGVLAEIVWMIHLLNRVDAFKKVLNLCYNFEIW